MNLNSKGYPDKAVWIDVQRLDILDEGEILNPIARDRSDRAPVAAVGGPPEHGNSPGYS